MALIVDHLHRILSRSFGNDGKHTYKITYILMYNMTVTWTIITKFTFEQQPFAKNSYTIFHENLTDHLVTETRSLIDVKVGGHGLFLLHKEHLKLL
jgi:hypothetical protein